MLESLLYRLEKVALSVGQEAENDLNQVGFWDGQEADKKFKVTFEPLKHRFLDFTQVAFLPGQEEENVFPVPADHLKHRFLDLTKDEFWACQEAENDV